MTYGELFKKYSKEGRALARKGDFVQASEKYWGATAELLKIIAEHRDWPHHKHRDLQVIVNHLFDETGDPDIPTFFDMAQALHANFYEDFLSEKAFRLHARRVSSLHGKLQKLNGRK